ncbi:putative membrane protein YeiH [Ochrobactrum daejeonense]|uniref:Putative membrane protein YeiH n=1 Tax=Brucella daejeonensis TaxID=659015 RepID=A0A7W9ATE4_9HYPH|nr:trimeric intracellular cation channel family protein [Brucella daejeonensis]MBB5700196.1 putative membrane protein YeiH [Brucella daejeonensis]
MTLPDFLNFAGVFVFAATGALAASRRQLDIIGFLFLANITGIGGGTLRDLVLGAPVFWVVEPAYLLAGTLAAIFVYFTAHRVESRYRVLLWLDAVGMAAYTVLGAAKGLALGFGPSVAIVTGIFTATLGGILRDMVAGEPSVLMRREIYVTASLAGACLYVLLARLRIEPEFCAAAAALAAFVIRGGALYFGWNLPVYKSRPGRTAEELQRDRIIRPE